MSTGDGVIEWLDEAITGGLEGAPSTNASQICPTPDTCYASLNYSGYPHTGGGTVPFMGDYNDVQPVVPFVNKGDTWQVPTLASDVPYDAAFVAAWADNRNVVPPTIGDWSNYAPPGHGPGLVREPRVARSERHGDTAQRLRAAHDGADELQGGAER